MEVQGVLPTLDGPVLVPGPVFVCFEIGGKPGHKGRHRSRLVIPKGVWTPAQIGGRTVMVITKDDSKRLFMQQYPDKDTEAYEQIVGLAGRRFMGSRPPTTNPVALLVHAFREIPASWSNRDRLSASLGGILPTSKPDGDNHLKVIKDGLNGIVWRDDSQVVDARVIKRYSDRPAMRVEVRELLVDQRVAG
jgi:Holliday junction resolvase RusA-like endonuclease